jgi:uncharacterized protein with FMN-binding domain
MFPKRGALALFVTILALVAILTYQTPTLSTPPADTGSLVAPPVAAASSADGTESASADSIDPSTGLPWATESATVIWSPMPGSTPGLTPGATPAPTTGSGVLSGPNATAPPPAVPPAPGTPAPITHPNPTPPPVTAPPRTPAPGYTGKLTGKVVTMQYGPVQVQAVYSSGRLTNVVTLQTPTGDSHSIAIAQRACPILRSEALTAQSANIHTVSGATYTSKAYIASLQSAIDKKP